MDLIKYDMTDIWAVAGDVVAPDSAKIRAGWGVEVVPRQWWNWFENRQDQNIAYMLQKGFPEWDATTQYINNKSYVQRNGIVYKATATSTNSDPVALTSWVRAFGDYSVANAALGSVTPAANVMPYFTGTNTAAVTSLTAFARTLLDDVDATTARTTLNAQTLNSNLTALSGVTAAVNGLPYFTSTTAMGIANLTAFGRSLLDDADAATARTTLGLGTGAVATVSTTNNPSTAGTLLKVGDYGWGVGSNGLPAMDTSDLNTATLSGVYRCVTATANMPAGFSQGALVITLMWNNATGAQIITQNGSSSMRGGSNLSTTPTWTSWLGTWNTNNLVKTTGQTDATAGRVTLVGDFGVGTGVAPTATDANTITISGMYAFNSPASGANIPVITNGMLTHQAWAGTAAAAQTFVTTSDGAGRMFFRSRTSDTWQSWKEVINTSNQQAIIDTAVTSAVTQAATSAANLYLAKTGGTLTGSLVIDTGASGNASIEMGTKTRSSTPFIDFNSSTGNTDYDSRILASGGNATLGQGALTYLAKGGHFFTSGAITATDGVFGNVTGTLVGSATGNAGTATALQTARTISLSGGASGSVSFNGTANVAIPVTIAISGVTGLQAALDGKLAATDISANYYNKTQTDGRYPIGTNAYLNISNSSVPTMSAASDTYGASAISIHNGSNNAAISAMSFVRDGSFGTWFGLDTDNELAWGGWSHGNVRYRIWSEKNFNPNLYVTAGAFGSTLVAASSAGVVGSYAMLVNTSGSNVGPGSTLASGLTYASTTSNAGGAAGGTWRAMGNGNNNGTTLWLRIA